MSLRYLLKGRVSVAAGVVVVALAAPCVAGAVSVSETFSAVNGEGSYDGALPCSVGDGPSWRFAYSGGSSPASGPLAGLWSGTFEAHDAGFGDAFVPIGTGRMAISLSRGGTAYLTMSAGDCGSAPLSLGTAADGNPLVSGTVDALAAGGSGAADGFAGSGHANVSLELGPGANNPASIALAGNFSVAAPKLSVSAVTSRWASLADWLKHRLGVFVTISDDAAAGDAFGVGVTAAKTLPVSVPSGLPSAAGTITAGGSVTVPLTLTKAKGHAKYLISVTVAAQDGMGGQLVPVVLAGSFTSPSLP